MYWAMHVSHVVKLLQGRVGAVPVTAGHAGGKAVGDTDGDTDGDGETDGVGGGSGPPKV